MTIVRADFEPISFVQSRKVEVSPLTPGFADMKIDINDKNLGYKILTDEEIEQIKKSLWRDGYNAASQEFDRDNQKMQQFIKDALQNIGGQIEELSKSNTEISLVKTKILVDIAIKTAKKFVGKLVDANINELIKATVEKVVLVLVKEPSITIYVNPKIKNMISDNIVEIKNKTSFRGEIIIKEDEQLHEINCFVEWHDGMIECNNEFIWDEIDKIIKVEHLEKVSE